MSGAMQHKCLPENSAEGIKVQLEIVVNIHLESVPENLSLSLTHIHAHTHTQMPLNF